jgi:cysteinyl-tRNA synthetase
MHNGLLTMASGQKMGKSLGNVINIHTALEEFPAEAIRIYYLHTHYRSPLPWSSEALPEALGMLSRLYDALEKASVMEGDEDADKAAKELGEDALTVLALGRGFADKFYAAGDQDFNTAHALAHVFELARALNRFAAHKKAKKRGRPVVTPALASFAILRRIVGMLFIFSCFNSVEY